MWDLKVMVLDRPEDIVFGEILVSTNILDFSWLIKAQKWTKAVKFEYVSFEENSTFWKILQILCLHNVKEYLLEVLWQNQVLFGEKRTPNFPKWAISWMLNQYKNLWKFVTWQLQMLYLWKLPWLCNFIRPLFWQKLGA